MVRSNRKKPHYQKIFAAKKINLSSDGTCPATPYAQLPTYVGIWGNIRLFDKVLVGAADTDIDGRGHQIFLLFHFRLFSTLIFICIFHDNDGGGAAVASNSLVLLAEYAANVGYI